MGSLGEIEKLQQEQMDIKCLQVLRGIVHNEIVKLPTNWTTNMKHNKRSVVYIRQYLLCHVMSCHVMSCHVMSCHVMSCHVMVHQDKKSTCGFYH